MKSTAIVLGEFITKKQKYIDGIKKKSSSSEPPDKIQPNFAQLIVG